MFKIGDFAKLSCVSVKTLRYYDELGLLKPAHVDHFTGYRYYSADQQRVQDEQSRLVRVEARLRLIEQEDTIPYSSAARAPINNPRITLICANFFDAFT